MGIFDEMINPKPKFVTDIVTKIKSYFIDVNPDLVRALQDEAIFYAENENNREKIEQGMENGKNAEYFSLLFIYLGTRAVILRGEFHIYAGVVSMEGNVAFGIACDCLDRMVSLKFAEKGDADAMKAQLKASLSDPSIG
jgi:hypothetical protein